MNGFIDFALAVLRLSVFALGLWNVTILANRFRKGHNEWNSKTSDLWYAAFMWACAGVVLSIQGVVLHRPLTPATIFVFAAVLVQGKGLHQKGSWGSDA